MIIDTDDLDIEKLRKDLIDHFSAIMFTVSPVALVDLTEVEHASEEELVHIAVNNRFDLNKYLKSKSRSK